MALKIHTETALKPEQPAVVPMSTSFRLFIEVAMWGVPAFFAGLAGALLGSPFNFSFYGAIALVILWSAILVAGSIGINSEQEFVVVERFGRYIGIKRRSIYLLLFKITGGDKIVRRGTFMAEEVKLFREEDDLIDFTDGSARVDASAWTHIANPVDVAEGRWKLVQGQVSRWAYAEGDPEERRLRSLEGSLRPLLQRLSTDEVQLRGDECAEEAIEESRPALLLVGIYPRPAQAIIVHDVRLSDEAVEARSERLQGLVDAQTMAAKYKGVAAAIRAIITEAKLQGETLTWKEARQIFERQQGLDALTATDANITFVAPNVGDVLKTIEVGSNKGKA